MHWARLLALLVGQLRRLDVAEDALADAFSAAVTAWSRDGVPDNPPAWLLTVARRRATDLLRREMTQARKLPLLITDDLARSPEEEVTESMTTIRDERLRLIFTCAHPALAAETRIALTLRCVGGLTTAEVARSLLVSESTMAARLTRAKKRIAAAGIPYRVPTDADLPERLGGVLTVLYLIFTEGYAASSGAVPVRRELAEEAIRLARVIVELMPDEPEVRALLALMLLQHARRDARVDADGGIVLLAEQDRRDWHRAEIDEALDLLSGRPQPVGEYRLQALIAAEHSIARTAADTDWAAIAGYYGELERRTGSPIVRLNRAVAVAERDGPAAGLSLLDGLAGPLARNHLFFATRAEFARRTNDLAAARRDLQAAIELARTEAERDLLRRRLEGL